MFACRSWPGFDQVLGGSDGIEATSAEGVLQPLPEFDQICALPTELGPNSANLGFEFGQLCAISGEFGPESGQFWPEVDKRCANSAKHVTNSARRPSQLDDFARMLPNLGHAW